jgi:serine/threonine protein kinase/tetratricopeptide (TPR) repeat protein
MKCPKCLTDNPSDSKFCRECATPLPVSRETSAPQTETLKTPIKELATGSIFAGRYQIIEELGKGGMGKVYKVLDTEIKEKVALKLLKSEIAADSETIERFRNELKFARKIRHTNVCQMFDLAKDEGSYYITMEYVHGEDLKRLIRKMGQLSAGQAVSIGRQLCGGLAEAHRLGVVHRDLKPQNIMVDEEGNARIMDFGIARSVKAKAITGAGVMIGTPEYMSPEQVEGKEADHRSDIYSLGIVLYEMVTGRVPFEGDTPFTIGVKHKSEMPKNPREINAQIPEDLGRLILKCLAKDKDKRYQSANDLAADLAGIEKELPTTEKLVSRRKAKTEQAPRVGRRKYALYGAVVVLAILIVAAGIFLFRGRGLAITSIAVMPFSYAGSGGTEMEYLAEGMTESIINNLSQLPRLKKVIARSSVFHYKGKEIIPKAVGQELGVDAVLISRMNQRGDELSISVELVNTLDSSRIWGNQYKKKVSEVFDFQKEISNSIAENLRLKLTGEELKRIGKRYTESPEAYQAYVRGRFFWNKRTEEGLKTAIGYFEQAVEKDPNYALAYAGLADAYCILPQYSSFPQKEAFEKATPAAAKALELDDTIAEAHTAFANIHVFWDWDWEGARKEFQRAIELNPSYATAHHWYAFLLMFLGQFDESIEQITQAQELDPLSLIINANMGFMRYYARRYDEAIGYYRKAIEMDPNFNEIHWYLGMGYCQKKLYEEAIQELQRAVALSGWPKHQGSLGYAYVLAGKKDEAVKIVDDLKRKGQDKYYAAIVYAALGDKDRAFECLEKSYKERSDDIPYVKIEPALDSLHSDPRFKALLKKINLE